MKRKPPTVLSPEAFAEAWPKTVIVQQPVAQLAGSGKVIVHPPGAQTSAGKSAIVQAPLAPMAPVSPIVHQPGAQIPWYYYPQMLSQ